MFCQVFSWVQWQWYKLWPPCPLAWTFQGQEVWNLNLLPCVFVAMCIYCNYFKHFKSCLNGLFLLVVSHPEPFPHWDMTKRKQGPRILRRVTEALLTYNFQRLQSTGPTKGIVIPNPTRHDGDQILVRDHFLYFSSAWENSWAKEVVPWGMPQDLSRKIPHVPTNKNTLKYQRTLVAIHHLLEVIEPLPLSVVFFKVPPKNGDWEWSWIWNIKASSCDYNIIKALRSSDFLTSIDLVNAYLHILIIQSHITFLGFAVDKAQFQFRAHPFN